VGLKEIRSVTRVLRSGNLAQGKEVLKFEKAFSSLVSQRECVAVNSGTSALYIACLSLGIGIGDEVILPSFSFAATANAVALTGATPIFVDIQAGSYNIDPAEVEKRITSKTKAILVVHLYGLCADMPSILSIARKFDLLVIEDAAQAHLASINGNQAGTFGDAAAFSFYPTKNMTSGEGGMLVLKDNSTSRFARMFRNQGMEVRYQNEIIGMNLRMTDIHAAIGNVQILQLEKRTQAREENAAFLSERLQGVDTPKFYPGYRHVYHQYTILTKSDRKKFRESLLDFGVQSDTYYPNPIHKLKPYQSGDKLPVTDSCADQVLSIPVHPALTKKDLLKIVNAVNKSVEIVEG
jgi:perosamine synthetase